jgi:hypothetical protein
VRADAGEDDDVDVGVLVEGVGEFGEEIVGESVTERESDAETDERKKEEKPKETIKNECIREQCNFICRVGF